jgi:hypothetical protein
MKKFFLGILFLLVCFCGQYAEAQVALCKKAAIGLAKSSTGMLPLFPVRPKSLLSKAQKMHPNSIRLFVLAKRRYIVLFDRKIYDFHRAPDEKGRRNHPDFFEIAELTSIREIKRAVGWNIYSSSRTKHLHPDEAKIFRQEIEMAMKDPQHIFKWAEADLEDRFQVSAKHLSWPLAGKGRRLAQIGWLGMAGAAISILPWPWSYYSSLLDTHVGPLSAYVLRSSDRIWNRLDDHDEYYPQYVYAVARGLPISATRHRQAHLLDRLQIISSFNKNIGIEFKEFLEKKPDVRKQFIEEALKEKPVHGKIPNKLLRYVFPSEKNWNLDRRKNVPEGLLAYALVVSKVYDEKDIDSQLAYLKRLAERMKHGEKITDEVEELGRMIFVYNLLSEAVKNPNESMMGREVVQLMTTDLQPLLSQRFFNELTILTIGQLKLKEFEPWLVQTFSQADPQSDIYPFIAWSLHHLDTETAHDVTKNKILPELDKEIARRESEADPDLSTLQYWRLKMISDLIHSGKKRYLHSGNEDVSEFGIKSQEAQNHYSKIWWATFVVDPS